MMSKLKNSKAMMMGFAAVLLSLSFYPFFTRVMISSGDVHCQLPEQSFTLSWIHSVERALWRESYQVKNGALHLYRSQFKTFGAGTPYNEASTLSDGFVETAPNVQLPVLYWMISRNVTSTIEVNHQVWPIHQDFDDYTEITLTTTQHNIWTLLKENSCHDLFSISNR